ncbi:MAG: DUF1800 domain-containing protein [Minwuia sp.]|uniref:DUF1800 domain-containing protein n=1 Tax=Minwuia sp. TaxID=2493630 RepID=UPI003A85041A
MTFQQAAIASIRFGLGARPGEIEGRAADPGGSLIAELIKPDTSHGLFDSRPTSALMISRFMRERDKGGDRAIIRLFKQDFRQTYLEEAALRTAAAVRSRTPFAERLVHFWSNHFTVSARRAILAGLAGAYEREAIRASLNLRFEDMLLAVVRHPAMILYLDNALSIGPNSRIARRRDIGMNENLAREVLELHTLGVDGGYGQADVVALAKMLTGWSIAKPDNSPEPGTFRFYARAHEPGAQTLLGRRYAEDGKAQAEAALRDLARHPATIRHVATQLVRHFTDDAPAPADIDRIVAVWQETGGSLPAIHGALVGLDSAWQPLTKLKTPNDLLISTLRASAFDQSQRWTVAALDLLGQAPWNAPSPKGWADTAPQWLSADQAMRRVEFANRWAERAPVRRDARKLAAEALGPLMGTATERAIARAESAEQGLALAFAAPDFQRR